MNVDNFKQEIIMASSQMRLAWSEFEGYEGEGCNIYTPFFVPNFNGATLDLYLTDKTMQIVLSFNYVSNSEDTLKLMNDFNEHCPYLKAYTTPHKKGFILCVASNLAYISDEKAGVKYFETIIQMLHSDPIQAYLRPLTILAK